MKPGAFAYVAPESLPAALDALAGFGEEASVLAGGQSLVPMMNFRLARPAALVDINRVTELDYIREDAGSIEIGAITRHRRVERSPLVVDSGPLLAGAVRYIGHPQIRNRGTVGGSVAHADPAAEIPAVLTAVAGEVVVAGASGDRRVSAQDFFVSYFTTDLRPGEMVRAVRIPVLAGSWGWAFHELTQRSGDFCIAAVAAGVLLSSSGAVEQARVALAGVGETPLRAPAVEHAVAGRTLAAGLLDELGRLAAADLRLVDDVRAPASYRRDMIGVLTARALAEAGERASRVISGSTSGGDPA